MPRKAPRRPRKPRQAWRRASFVIDSRILKLVRDEIRRVVHAALEGGARNPSLQALARVLGPPIHDPAPATPAESPAEAIADAIAGHADTQTVFICPACWSTNWSRTSDGLRCDGCDWSALAPVWKYFRLARPCRDADEARSYGVY